MFTKENKTSLTLFGKVSCMKINKITYCFIFLFVAISSLKADTRIVLALRHAPEDIIDQAARQADAQNILNSFANFEQKPPSKLSRKMIKGQYTAYFKPALGGFMAIYAGYITYSDLNGIISFPLRHSAPKIYLAITSEIRLIKVRDNTVSHREYAPQEAPVQLYVFEKKQENEGQVYWSIKEEKVPTNNKINPLTLILLTKPKNIVVAPGDYITNPGIQLVLPEVYVVGNGGVVQTILKSLDYKSFFERIKVEEKKVSDTVIQKISTNI